MFPAKNRKQNIMLQVSNKNEALVEASDATLGRLYIAVCSDNEKISLGLQSAQAVHVGFSFATKHPEITNSWLTDSQYLVIVSVPTSFHILELAEKADKLGIDHIVWREPDLGNQPTAIALAPIDASRILCANLPLMGKAPRKSGNQNNFITPSYFTDEEGDLRIEFLNKKKHTVVVVQEAGSYSIYHYDDEDETSFSREDIGILETIKILDGYRLPIPDYLEQRALSPKNVDYSAKGGLVTLQ